MDKQNQGGTPPINNLTNKELERSLWFLRHKSQLFLVLKIILIAVNAILFGWVFWKLIDVIFISGPAERANLATQKENAIPYAELNRALTPGQLNLGPVQIFGGRENKYDLAMTLKNTNIRTWAEFEYKFVGANFETAPRRDFILPDSQKFLLELGVEHSARPQNMRLVFTEFSWHRLSRHTVPDYVQFRNEHLNFLVSDIVFSRPILDRGAFNEVKFKIKNNSAYNFWAVPVTIALHRGEQTVGVNAVTIEKLRSLETREVSLVWEEGLPEVRSVEAAPNVNILDPAVYMP